MTLTALHAETQRQARIRRLIRLIRFEKRDGQTDRAEAFAAEAAALIGALIA